MMQLSLRVAGLTMLDEYQYYSTSDLIGLSLATLVCFAGLYFLLLKEAEKLVQRSLSMSSSFSDTDLSSILPNAIDAEDLPI